MSILLSGIGLFTYDGYVSQFQKWVHADQTSTKEASLSLIEFTKLNWARSQRIHKTISLNEDLKKAVKKLQHNYTWYVITEAWCGDSAQNLPVIAEMASLNPDKIELLIMLRDENPDLIKSYLTNGTRAIPKLIAVDDSMNTEAFVWGPRPQPAQELLVNWKKNPEGKAWEDFEKDLHTWYAKNKTEAIQSEFTSLLLKLI